MGEGGKHPRRGKVWSARLGAVTSPAIEGYTSSLDIDRRLYAEDVAGSIAHARMLRDAGLINREQHQAIEQGLMRILGEFESNAFVFDGADEDIHMAVERRLHEIAGAVAGRLHTGRSRNDQVATDLRLYALSACLALVRAATDLQDALVWRAQEHHRTVMPAYTHGQRAQPVSLAHHLLAYVEMLQRDIGRLLDARRRSDVLPLGSGAVAGSTLSLDRRAVATELGFSEISANSIDAVSDRDFAVEVTAACALLMVHCSRLSEELVWWASSEFGFAELPDTHATGSSLMPQKKNPDAAELARGRTARVVGDVVTLMTLLKGLPLAYNRDLQEDKRALFDAVDTAAATLAVLTELVQAVRFNTDAMRAAAADPALLATDIAEYLVERGVPFREAHEIVGSQVRRVAEERRTLRDLSVAEWREACSAAGDDIVELFDVDSALHRRNLLGGPGPRSVSHQIGRAIDVIEATRRAVDDLAARPILER
ncbi:MAG: argininosuccinate lyase [Chloroflexi bacterium]|nr:MAG: argininosuccinate lyase [Chloroflexota bacterium]TMF15569.1 MAG: argininosuccinate lyase [Chloroflexota bacterium]